jgi:hypothetical protein
MTQTSLLHYSILAWGWQQVKRFLVRPKKFTAHVNVAGLYMSGFQMSHFPEMRT